MRFRYQIPINWKKSPFLSKSIEIRSCADITSCSAHVCVFSSEVLILFLKLFILGFPGMLAVAKSYTLLPTPFSPSIFSLHRQTLKSELRNISRELPHKVERIPILSGQNHFKLYNSNPALSSPCRQLLPVKEKQLLVVADNKTAVFFIPVGKPVRGKTVK